MTYPRARAGGDDGRVEAIDRLETARAAAEAGRWEEAREHSPLRLPWSESADALDGLGRACWWLGDVRSAIRHRERAFTLLRQAGRDDEAAIVALDLCVWYLTNLENDAAAGGWLARAARAAERTTDPVVRGWLVLIGAYLSSDATEQREGIEEARVLAVQASDDGLHAMALADLGLLLVAGGEVEDGMALLDEAMATTLGGYDGRLEVVVWSSCNMLAACSLVDDLLRAKQWCRVAEDFTQTYGCPFLQARCRAHYGSVLVAAGSWGLAEPELLRALSMSEDVGRQPLVEARTALAALRLRQGRLTEATELVEGLDTSVPAPPSLLRRCGWPMVDPRRLRHCWRPARAARRGRPARRPARGRPERGVSGRRRRAQGHRDAGWSPGRPGEARTPPWKGPPGSLHGARRGGIGRPL